MFGSNFPIESIWTDFSSLIGAWLGVLAEYPGRGATGRPRPDRTPRLQACRGGPAMTRPVQHTAAAVAAWLREGRRVVAGLLVEVEGSSPLDVGASMYIDDQGGIEGSITGGCVEGAVASAAMDIIESDGPPQLVTYGISDELAGTVGLMCGGIVHIFIHELTGERARGRAARPRGDDRAPPRRARHAARRRPRRAPSSTSTPAAPPAALGSGELLDKNAEREARGLLAEGRSIAARLRHRRRLARQRPARLRLDPGRAAADDRLRRDRLLERARAAGQGPRLPRHDRRPALGLPRSRAASRRPPRPRSAGRTRCSTASSSARATRC